MDFSQVLQYREAASSGCSSHMRLCLLTLVCSSMVLSRATFLGKLLIPWRSWYTRRHSGQRRKLASVMSISAHDLQIVCPQPGSKRGVLYTSKHTGHSIVIHLRLNFFYSEKNNTKTINISKIGFIKSVWLKK